MISINNNNNDNNNNYNIVIVIIKKIFFLPSFSFLFFSGIKENWPFKTSEIVLLGQFNFRVLFKKLRWSSNYALSLKSKFLWKHFK